GVVETIEPTDEKADVAPAPTGVALVSDAPAPARAPVDLAELPLQVPAAVVVAPPRPALPEPARSDRSVEPARSDRNVEPARSDRNAEPARSVVESRIEPRTERLPPPEPVVDDSALARAFDGLESQSLTFNACDVRVSGDAATATCQGSARYVPKVGSREPRVESRVWNFTLRRNGSE